MKVIADVGLGSGDEPLAQLLLALQIYKAFYSVIPGQIRAVHEDALLELRRIRDDAQAFSSQASEDAMQIGKWAEEILRSLQNADPSRLATQVHDRLRDDATQIVSGSLQSFTTAYRQLETATQKMNVAARQAESAIAQWQLLCLRRVWATAFVVCLAAVLLIFAAVWLLFLRPQS